jgi:hypothetical protein
MGFIISGHAQSYFQWQNKECPENKSPENKRQGGHTGKGRI